MQPFGHEWVGRPCPYFSEVKCRVCGEGFAFLFGYIKKYWERSGKTTTNDLIPDEVKRIAMNTIIKHEPFPRYIYSSCEIIYGHKWEERTEQDEASKRCSVCGMKSDAEEAPSQAAAANKKQHLPDVKGPNQMTLETICS